jgi:predicted porin
MVLMETKSTLYGLKASFSLVGSIVGIQLAEATVQVATNQYRPDCLYVETYYLNQTVSGTAQTTANGSPSSMAFNYSFGCSYQNGNGLAPYSASSYVQYNNWGGKLLQFPESSSLLFVSIPGYTYAGKRGRGCRRSKCQDR